MYLSLCFNLIKFAIRSQLYQVRTNTHYVLFVQPFLYNVVMYTSSGKFRGNFKLAALYGLKNKRRRNCEMFSNLGKNQ